MKIIAFGASNSKKSINKKLATFAAQQFLNSEIEILDLNEYEMPIYSIDDELSNAVPEKAILFADKIDSSDLVIISFAEHNGSYTVAFKNIFDWVSRVPNRTAFGDKKMFLLATSEGKMGAKTVLNSAVARFPYNGGNVIAHFSLPEFSKNFDENKGIINEEQKALFQKELNKIKESLQ